MVKPRQRPWFLDRMRQREMNEQMRQEWLGNPFLMGQGQNPFLAQSSGKCGLGHFAESVMDVIGGELKQ